MTKNFPPELSAAGEFYRNRDLWTTHVAERVDIHPTTRLVGIWIGQRVNRHTDNTWHQASTIAAKLGVSVRTVLRAVKTLEGEGLIVVRRDGRRGIKKAVNRYEMVYPWL